MNREIKVILGGHWSNHPGWRVHNEADQDITKPLKFNDESVDVIFTEHVIEHVSFADCISFMREAKRVLKPGGVFRIVCPMLDKLLSISLENEEGRTYVQNSLSYIYNTEEKLLEEIGLEGLFESPKTFLFNSMFREHGHKFIWDAQLMIKVLESLGYSDAREYDIDEGSNKEYCINRRRRALYLGNNWEEDASTGEVYDAESGVVEAIK